MSETNFPLITENSKPFIIAEMSGNHKQSLDHALKMVEAAAKTGVDALKLQTYTADTITLDLKEKEFFIDDKNSLWFGKSLYELYEEAHTPWEWHKPIMSRANELGLLCFSTPFDETSVEFLEDLNVPAYKIASFEVTHLPLIRKVASTGKPLIISTGMANVGEIQEIVKIILDSGCKNFVLLKCTSTYPASPENSNILTIPHMQKLFNCQVGLSDHTLGLGASLAAISHGAKVIEKHFIISREEGGVDSAFSMEPHEMKQLVDEAKRVWQSLGKITYGPTDAELKSVLKRRSLYIAEDMVKGDILTVKNLRVVRPGFGLKPKYINTLLGRKVIRDLNKGTPASWDIVF